jgi:AraC-like DNA-binding protein
MVGAPANVSLLWFSTDELPERERLPTFQEVFGRAIAKVDFEPLAGTQLRVQATVRAMPGLGAWIGAFSPVHGRRTRQFIADGNDDVTLCMCPEGGSLISQCGREVTHHEGDAVLLSNSDVLSTTMVQRSHHVSLSLPRKVMLTMVPDLEDTFVRPVSKDSEPLRLLKSYVGVLEEDHALTTPELCHLVVSHVYDLAAVALGASGEVARIAESHGVRAARLHAIKTDVLQALGDHDLTVTAIAARHAVTPRYVQILFESEGTTFSRFLLLQRLGLAHRMLCDPRFADRTVSAIAFEAGFGDLSHFNRDFRRRYGESPSDVRAATARRKES